MYWVSLNAQRDIHNQRQESHADKCQKICHSTTDKLGCTAGVWTVTTLNNVASAVLGSKPQNNKKYGKKDQKRIHT